MIYGYARVSTAGQSKDGNSLEDQTKALQAYGCQEIITEAFSGKSMERPQFSMLFQKLQQGDTLVVTKLDRFARTAIDGVSAVRELFNRGGTGAHSEYGTSGEYFDGQSDSHRYVGLRRIRTGYDCRTHPDRQGGCQTGSKLP